MSGSDREASGVTGCERAVCASRRLTALPVKRSLDTVRVHVLLAHAELELGSRHAAQAFSNELAADRYDAHHGVRGNLPVGCVF